MDYDPALRVTASSVRGVNGFLLRSECSFATADRIAVAPLVDPVLHAGAHMQQRHLSRPTRGHHSTLLMLEA